MCHQLGRSLDVSTMSVASMHPVTQQVIYVLLDPVHMIKLKRNLLQFSGVLLSENGRTGWRCIANLEKLHAVTGLSMTNKPTKRSFHCMGLPLVEVAALYTASRGKNERYPERVKALSVKGISSRNCPHYGMVQRRNYA